MKKEIPNRVFWILVGFAVFFGFLSRFLFLEDKAFHHDESLHAYYSNRVASGHAHEYSALLHGPFLYYFTGLVMWIFGSTDYVARSAAAFFSVLLLALPLLITKWLGRVATLALIYALLISPTFMYFGRFLREDAFVSVWVMGTIFAGYAYWQSSKPLYFYLASAFLAFHFVNKENSFLHVFIWFLAIFSISVFNKFTTNQLHSPTTEEAFQSSIEKKFLWLNAVSIFATIFILFYSSFFSHSKGSWHGVLDGLYRESLLYWWDQNQKRRIDGPFDYHLPIIANYEFLLLPFLALAWARVVLSCKKLGGSFLGSQHYFACAALLLLGTFLLPRLAFVPESCSYAEYCLQNVSPNLAEFFGNLAKALHFAHSRHLLQILCFIGFGAGGFFGSLKLNNKFEAFCWFWLTGALGTYSYVGEKVPWLTVYILLPMFVICAIEISRNLGFGPYSIANGTSNVTVKTNASSDSKDSSNINTKVLQTRTLKYASAIWLSLCAPFSLYKAINVSFLSPDATNERLVFTQTTPAAKQVRDRWKLALKENFGVTKTSEYRSYFNSDGKPIAEKLQQNNKAAQIGKKLKIGLYGDASWPFAWYVEEFQAGDFANPSQKNMPQLDALMIDYGRLEEAKRIFIGFDIYELSLRHWWVPGVNPNLKQIFGYFFSKQLYPRVADAPASDTGEGDTKVLYLEKPTSPYFAGLPKPSFLTLLAPAER